MSDIPDTPEIPPTVPESDFPGAVLMVPDNHWGFENAASADHPGACLDYLPGRKMGLLLQGTDAENVSSSRSYVEVMPSLENGLAKATAFRLAPRYFRLHRMKLYFPERLLGRLDDATLLKLRDELARLNPEE